MNYRRILVLTNVGRDPRPTFAALQSYVPSAEHLTVLALQDGHDVAGRRPQAAPEPGQLTVAGIETLWRSARESAVDVEIRLGFDVTFEVLMEVVASTGVDLVVVDVGGLACIPLIAELRKRTTVAVLYVPEGLPAAAPAGRLVCLAITATERAAIAGFLHAHAGRDDSAVLLTGRPLSEDEARRFRDAAGVGVEVQSATDIGIALQRLLAGTLGRGDRLLVVPRFPPAFLRPRHRADAVLVLPAAPGARGPERLRAIDVPDLLDDGNSIRVRAEYAVGLGRRAPIVNQELAFVSGRSVVARAFSRDGTAELPTGLRDSLGVFRCDSDPAGAAAPSSIEAQAVVLRADTRPRLLFDAELEAEGLRLVREVGWADPVGVRVRSTRSCRSLRARLRAAGLPPIVIDTVAVLDEGEALDVPAVVDSVRLARTAARMRACGFWIPAIVYRGPHRPSTVGFAALRPQELLEFNPASRGSRPARPSLASRLDVTTGSEVIPGNRIEVELDNSKARHWLLHAINHSERCLHFQVYMALDDDVGGPVEAALAAAAERGVKVRVLVDSLHGLHGSFGLRNPILDRLSRRRGVELRVGKPITRDSLPEDLKQRDHRKLVVADNRVALLGGRNLSHEYYRAFDEVPLTARATWRMVPWLDAGARVEGPAVAALERSFLEAWTEAGGSPFDIPACPRLGTSGTRVIVHRGLRDAFSIEAYSGLIDSARSHVYVVNGFPLLLEIQHALLRALKRGVRVRTLVGNVTPRHSDGAFQGPWAAARTVATSFVHSRVDPLVAAGGECYELVVPNQPGWDPSLGDIRPHVHAKTMSVDGQVCAVGSANLDVTAGYWESELMLVVEDEAIATHLEARFDELMATSHRIDPDDPGWRHRSDLRRWMRYWPGVLSA